MQAISSERSRRTSPLLVGGLTLALSYFLFLGSLLGVAKGSDARQPMVHPFHQGSIPNISAHDALCLADQLPAKIGQKEENKPYVEYIGCFSAWKLNLTGFVNVTEWQDLRDTLPEKNETAACAALCVRNNTYKQYQMAIVGGKYCYCIEESHRVILGRASQFHESTTCQPFISNYTQQFRVYSTTLQCPLNVSLCEKVKGCKLTTDPDSGEECCKWETDEEGYLSYYSGMIKYVIAIVFALAVIEAIVYGVMRRRAHLRGEGQWASNTVRRDSDEAEEMSERLLATFEPVGESSSAAPSSSPLGRNRSTSLIRPGDANALVSPLQMAGGPINGDDEKDDGEEGEEGDGCCSICLEDMKDKPSVRLPCKHTIHRECLKDFMAHELKKKDEITCPMCRAPVGSADEVPAAALSVPIPRSDN